MEPKGALSWAFEFENQPNFTGFCDRATNGIDKPVLNTFRMFAMMGGERVRALSCVAAELETMLAAGVKEAADVNALASQGERSVAVMAWDYHDDDLPANAERVLLRHYRIDEGHSNSYTVWKQLGSPQDPTPEQ